METLWSLIMYEMIKIMTYKDWLAILAVISAIGFGIAGTAIPPSGIIDSTMLYLIAQLLIFSATIMGFGDAVSKVTKLVDSVKGKGKTS